MTIKKTAALALLAICACGQKPKNGTATISGFLLATEPGGHCSLDPATDQTFACTSADGTVKIAQGYDAVKIYKLMAAREDNAWKQLSQITSRADMLAYSIMRARSGRDEYGKAPRLYDIRSVSLTRTMDTGSLTISMYTDTGERFTLWMEGNDENVPLNVRTVTPY